MSSYFSLKGLEGRLNKAIQMDVSDGQSLLASIPDSSYSEELCAVCCKCVCPTKPQATGSSSSPEPKSMTSSSFESGSSTFEPARISKFGGVISSKALTNYTKILINMYVRSLQINDLFKKLQDSLPVPAQEDRRNAITDNCRVRDTEISTVCSESFVSDRGSLLSRSTYLKAPSAATTSSCNTSGRVKIADMKDRAFCSKIIPTVEELLEPCGSSCPFKKSCITSIDLKTFHELRVHLWNEVDAPAPLDKVRAGRLLGYINKATTAANGSLIFNVGDKEVCESAFLRLLGLQKSKNISDAPGQWTRLKKECRQDGKDALSDEKLQNDERESRRESRMQATAYILKIAQDYSDTFATMSATAEDDKDDPNRDEKYENARQVPHITVTDFYNEYRHYCLVDLGIDCCSEGTFRTAFNELYEAGVVKLMGSKLGFAICPVCVNCHSILTGTSRDTNPMVKTVAQSLKRLHLKMQQHERQNAENVIFRCRELDAYGQPISAYIDIDGMTVITCDTPKYSKGRQADVNHHIENRNIGARLVCGPVDRYISINTNNIIPGGANVLVEATRICIETLADILQEEHKKQLPTNKIYFQFDNCSENKNKTMHCFFTDLVERGYFKEIEVHRTCSAMIYFPNVSLT